MTRPHGCLYLVPGEHNRPGPEPRRQIRDGEHNRRANRGEGNLGLASQAQDTDDRFRRKPDSRSDRQTFGIQRRDFAVTAVPVLTKAAVPNGDPATPVLGVYNKHSRRSDDDVVNVGASSAGEPPVVEVRETGRCQLLQHACNRNLTDTALSERRSPLLESVGLLTQLMRLR